MENLEPKVGAAAESESANTRNFLRIALFSTALGFGCVAGAVECLRADPMGFSFHVTVRTFAAFCFGASLGLFCWRLAARGGIWARIGFALLTLAGVAAFLSPLRFVTRTKRGEVAIGLAVAFVVLSTGGYLIWRISRFLSEEAARTEKNSKD